MLVDKLKDYEVQIRHDILDSINKASKKKKLKNYTLRLPFEKLRLFNNNIRNKLAEKRSGLRSLTKDQDFIDEVEILIGELESLVFNLNDDQEEAGNSNQMEIIRYYF